MDDLPIYQHEEFDPWKEVEKEVQDILFQPVVTNTTNKHPLIHLSLPKFLDILWNYQPAKSNYMSTYAYVDVPLGELITLLDPQQRYCHVEYTTHPDTILPTAQVWQLNEWKSAYERRLISDERRRVEQETKNYSNQLAADIMILLTTIPPFDCMDAKLSFSVVRQLLRKRDFRKISFMTEGKIELDDKTTKIII